MVADIIIDVSSFMLSYHDNLLGYAGKLFGVVDAVLFIVGMP